MLTAENIKTKVAPALKSIIVTQAITFCINAQSRIPARAYRFLRRSIITAVPDESTSIHNAIICTRLMESAVFMP